MISSHQGQVTGIFVAYIEFAEYWGGDAYFVLHSIGLTDEIEVENNKWMKNVFLKENDCKEVVAVLETAQQERIDRNLSSVFGLMDYKDWVYWAKL